MNAGWQVIAASAVGAAHTDGVNQDAFAQRVLGPDVVVAAVADGHGGRHYVRSARGAQLAVEIAVETATQALTPGPSVDLVGVCREVVRRWRAAVSSDLQARPFTTAEQAKSGRDPATQPFLAYGATLLLAVVAGGRADIAQIGDGDVMALSGGESVDAPVPGDQRLSGGMTTSLGGDTAANDFRFGAIDKVDMLVLASDGYGNSFAEPQWQRAVLRDLQQAIAAHGVAAVQREFGGWLRDSAQAGGDDVTALAVVNTAAAALAPPVGSGRAAVGAAPGPDLGERTVMTPLPTVLSGTPGAPGGPPAGSRPGPGRDAAGRPVTSPAPPGVGRAGPPMSAPASSRRPRTGWWIAGVLAALILGGGVGYALARGPLAPDPVVEQVSIMVPVTVTDTPVPTTSTMTATTTATETVTASVTAENSTASTESSAGPPANTTQSEPPAQLPPGEAVVPSASVTPTTGATS